jgi:hypothetical protein
MDEKTIKEMTTIQKKFKALYQKGVIGIDANSIQLTAEEFNNLIQMKNITPEIVAHKNEYYEKYVVIDDVEIVALFEKEWKKPC